MNMRALRQIRFENHFRTLKTLGPRLAGVGFVDGNGQCVWCDRSDTEHVNLLMSAYRRLLPSDLARDAASTVQQVDVGGVQVKALPVLDGGDAFVCRMLLMLDQGADSGQEAGLPADDLAVAVAKSVSTEYDLTIELESMAAELEDRYEELNLVFRADGGSGRSLFGLESLRELVRDTTEYLGVGMTGLVMPAKHFELFDFNSEKLIKDKKSRLQALSTTCFDRLRVDTAPIVVNNERDFADLRLQGSFSYKCIMIPIKGVDGTLLGALLAANDASQKDFSNSDRNLLEVVGGKVTDVLKMNFDALTGLENSQSFEWAVGQALLQARTRGQKHAVLSINIDNTGLINDLGGRAAGDALIRMVGKELLSQLRTHDAVARVGGDEFGVLLETCSTESANLLARKLAHRIEQLHFSWDGTDHGVSVCIGVTPLTAESESVAAVLSNASVAREAAKEGGRGRIQVYEQNDLELQRRRGEFQWVARLQTALRKDQFALFAQEIRPLRGGGIDVPHYEILLRLRDDRGDVIAPGQFIPAAEHFHLMPEIDKWVIQQSCAVLRSSAEGDGSPPFLLSVNLSGQSLSDERVQDFVCRELNRLGPLARYLCLEITESAAIANIDAAISFIAAAKSFGCRFSLDDFGSGLSSFSYLKQFDVDYLKIDGSFVRHIGEDEVAAAMVAAINQVGQVMGLQTIAEFVENELIVQILKGIGVNFGQGYHFQRPTPLEAVQRGCLRAGANSGG